MDKWIWGYYDIRFTGADGASGHHMLCVKAAKPSTKAVIVLATNTYHAYNSWGGANTYVWIGGPLPAPIPADAGRHVVAARRRRP